VLAWQFGGGSSQPISRPAPVRPATRSTAPKARPTPHRKPLPIPVLSLKAARGRCWIDAHLDGARGRVVYIGTLAQGTTIRFSLRRPLWIRLGAPSTLDARIGGKPVTDLPTQTLPGRIPCGVTRVSTPVAGNDGRQPAIRSSSPLSTSSTSTFPGAWGA
jgi:Domain of unknown function (DUF4115)